MHSANDIAELERLLDRILLDEDAGRTGELVARAGELLGRTLSRGANDVLASSSADEASFQRCVVIASAIAVLQSGLAAEESEVRSSCIANVVLSAECRRLRQHLGRTQIEATQWRERSLASRVAGAASAGFGASVEAVGCTLPPPVAQQERERIAVLIGAFKRSWHWRIGHAVVTLAEGLLRRQSKPTALDAAEAIARSESP